MHNAPHYQGVIVEDARARHQLIAHR